jgi:SPP1 family predicted phage head-tail adaptor
MQAAGQFNQRVVIEAPTAARDPRGQRSAAAPTWSPVATVWAHVQPLRGREYFAAGAMQSEASVRFRLRWRDGITGAMRVVWRGVAYAIVAPPIDVDGGCHTLELMCAAGGRDSRPQQSVPGPVIPPVPARTLSLSGRALSLSGRVLTLTP